MEEIARKKEFNARGIAIEAQSQFSCIKNKSKPWLAPLPPAAEDDYPSYEGM